jgi:hypothetical protein
LIGVLAFAAADPLWTLWRIEDGGGAVRSKTGMERQDCETYRQTLEHIANVYVEIDRDVVQLREKPVGTRVHYRCRLDGEGPRDRP